MRFSWRSRRTQKYTSLAWYKSQAFPGVRYAVRRISLGQRIELTQRARELSLRTDFLRAGEAADQFEAALSELLIRRMYLEWGLVSISGLWMDGQPSTVPSVIDKGPEELTDEIVESLRSELGLTEEERKNS